MKCTVCGKKKVRYGYDRCQSCVNMTGYIRLSDSRLTHKQAIEKLRKVMYDAVHDD